MQACAKRYAEGLDGRSSFKTEEECCLKEDLYALSHKDGYREECDYELCDKQTRSDWVEAVRARVPVYFYPWLYPWLLFRYNVKGYPWHSWWLDWKLDNLFLEMGKEEDCECEECAKPEKEEMQAKILDQIVSGWGIEGWMVQLGLKRCLKPDHVRKVMKYADPMKMRMIEVCQDCEDPKEEEWCGWCRYRHQLRDKSAAGLWRNLSHYPMDLWLSWQRELDPDERQPTHWRHPDGYCLDQECSVCLWAKAGGWFGKESSRLSYRARFGLLANLVWESIWAKEEESTEAEEE